MRNEKSVLVTGACGFIGSHLCEELVRRGYRVKALVMYNAVGFQGWLEYCPLSIKNEMEIVAGDIRDPFAVEKAMRDCGSIFHLAALIGIPYSYNAPQSYLETNVSGTLNILQAAINHNIEKIVYTSTSEVYGTACFVPITEAHPLQAQSPYAASKIGAEQLALSYHRSFETPVTIVRPFNTYGPRQSARAVIPTIITQLTSNYKSLTLGSLHPTRDFNYVEDVTAGFIAVGESADTIGQIVNIGSGFEISISDVAKTIAQIMGVEITFNQTQDRVRPSNSEVERLWADNTRIKDLTGWTPKYSGIEGFRKGLAKTIEWFKDPEVLLMYKPGVYNV